MDQREDRTSPVEPQQGAEGPTPSSAPGVVANGWLAAQSTFDHASQRRMGRALGTSVALHVGMAALIVFLLSLTPAREILEPIPLSYDLVFLRAPGPGGGGGGSPAPAPPKPVEVPESKPPEPAPVVPPLETPVEPPPKPVLDTPIQTSNAQMLQYEGTTSVSIAPVSGGGRGGGVGPGRGTGVGPGEGGGFGGGAYRPGAGIENPELVRDVEPKYTSEAMRNKIQGVVELDAVVLPNGTVGDVQIVRSLDRQFGLDQEAIKAARQWLFRPARLSNGEPVPIVVRLILEFRLH
jgi:protein TonB